MCISLIIAHCLFQLSYFILFYPFFQSVKQHTASLSLFIHMQHLVYIFCIYLSCFFTDPNFGRKQKLTEIHQALIRWKQFKKMSLCLSLRDLGRYIKLSSFKTNEKSQSNLNTCSCLLLLLCFKKRFGHYNKQCLFCHFTCTVIQLTLRPWREQQPVKEDCSPMKWGGKFGLNCWTLMYTTYHINLVSGWYYEHFLWV